MSGWKTRLLVVILLSVTGTAATADKASKLPSGMVASMGEAYAASSSAVMRGEVLLGGRGWQMDVALPSGAKPVRGVDISVILIPQGLKGGARRFAGHVTGVHDGHLSAVLDEIKGGGGALDIADMSLGDGLVSGRLIISGGVTPFEGRVDPGPLTDRSARPTPKLESVELIGKSPTTTLVLTGRNFGKNMEHGWITLERFGDVTFLPPSNWTDSRIDVHVSRPWALVGTLRGATDGLPFGPIILNLETSTCTDYDEMNGATRLWRAPSEAHALARLPSPDCGFIVVGTGVPPGGRDKDAMVMRLDGFGRLLREDDQPVGPLFIDVFGGDDAARGLVIGSEGQIFIVGEAGHADGSGSDVLVARIDPEARAVEHLETFGADGRSVGLDIDIAGRDGAIVAAGWTDSVNLHSGRVVRSEIIAERFLPLIPLRTYEEDGRDSLFIRLSRDLEADAVIRHGGPGNQEARRIRRLLDLTLLTVGVTDVPAGIDPQQPGDAGTKRQAVQMLRLGPRGALLNKEIIRHGTATQVVGLPGNLDGLDMDFESGRPGVRIAGGFHGAQGPGQPTDTGFVLGAGIDLPVERMSFLPIGSPLNLDSGHLRRVTSIVSTSDGGSIVAGNGPRLLGGTDAFVQRLDCRDNPIGPRLTALPNPGGERINDMVVAGINLGAGLPFNETDIIVVGGMSEENVRWLDPPTSAFIARIAADRVGADRPVITGFSMDGRSETAPIPNGTPVTIRVTGENFSSFRIRRISGPGTDLFATMGEQVIGPGDILPGGGILAQRAAIITVPDALCGPGGCPPTRYVLEVSGTGLECDTRRTSRTILAVSSFSAAASGLVQAENNIIARFGLTRGGSANALLVPTHKPTGLAFGGPLAPDHCFTGQGVAFAPQDSLYGLAATALTGGGNVRRAVFDPNIPSLLLYDINGLLTGWGYTGFFAGNPPAPVRPSVPADAWFGHWAGWHTADGGMVMEPGTSMVITPVCNPLVHGLTCLSDGLQYRHNQFWDVHVFRDLTGVSLPRIGMLTSDAGVGFPNPCGCLARQITGCDSSSRAQFPGPPPGPLYMFFNVGPGNTPIPRLCTPNRPAATVPDFFNTCSGGGWPP